ncbi:hypothetical protein [Hymenobacter lapidiphilus]|uniref:Uncharacterized protein n=1 Tax=Hymenobacter lapidiphilus TaxID=2608003 RepID=A0A7Y7PKZ7_9BACT|nr:hypothetical protein [Hymenobacter lapidiphilus]NVO29768.1 hypothetical protein [Hymenobacter lapidiphilus]
MQAPLPPLRHVPPYWVRTSTGGGGAFADGTHRPEPATTPLPTPPPAEPVAESLPEPLPEQPAESFEPLLPPPPTPELFATLRSEDGRLELTNDGLELNTEQFSWRELEGVDVQPVRWLLGVLLGAFLFLGFLSAYLQFWLKTVPAALGIGLGLALLAWGLRGTNRWRVHRPGRQTRYFSLGGPANGWLALAREANRRIGQRHHETATAAGYWLQQTAFIAPAAASTEEAGPDTHAPV